MKCQVFAAVPLFASVVYSHGVILAAKGPNSKVASVGMQVVLSLARNCTNISPCQQDTSLIRDAEITANVVNECGRTELGGNIDIGENTENQLAAQQVADVNAGETVDVTIHQINADGAGPYTCDLEQTGNTGVFEFKNLTVTNNVPGQLGFSQAKEQDFTMQVQLPQEMNCTGSSQGNVCTLRCRNNALAGPFGGCVALQQKDGGGRVSADPADVNTNLTVAAVEAQVQSDKIAIDSAIAANQQAGTDAADQGVKNADALVQNAGLNLQVSPFTSIAAPVAGGTAATAAPPAPAQATPAAGDNAAAAAPPAPAATDAAAAPPAAAGNASADQTQSQDPAAEETTDATTTDKDSKKGRAGKNNAAAGGGGLAALLGGNNNKVRSVRRRS